MAKITDKIKEEVKKREKGLKKIIDEVKDEIETPSKSTNVLKDVKENVKEELKETEEIVEGVKKSKSVKTEKKEKSIKIQKTDKVLKEAEAESTSEEKSLEEKKKELLEKVKKLKGKLDKAETEELKEKIKLKKKTEMLLPLDEYVKAGIYLGTRVVTPSMRPFIYRRRADGLAIFNTDIIDDKLREGIEFLSTFPPEEIILVCKRQAGWKVAEKLGEITGIRVFTRKYPAGILTNTALPNFFENELTIITDHWVDKNALNDTLKVNKKVLMICDTNNFSEGADVFIIGNNKSLKSLGLIFYLFAREYCKARKIEADIPELEWWTGEVEESGKGNKAIIAEASASSAENLE